MACALIFAVRTLAAQHRRAAPRPAHRAAPRALPPARNVRPRASHGQPAHCCTPAARAPDWARAAPLGPGRGGCTGSGRGRSAARPAAAAPPPAPRPGAPARGPARTPPRPPAPRERTLRAGARPLGAGAARALRAAAWLAPAASAHRSRLSASRLPRHGATEGGRSAGARPSRRPARLQGGGCSRLGAHKRVRRRQAEVGYNGRAQVCARMPVLSQQMERRAAPRLAGRRAAAGADLCAAQAVQPAGAPSTSDITTLQRSSSLLCALS